MVDLDEKKDDDEEIDIYDDESIVGDREMELW